MASGPHAVRMLWLGFGVYRHTGGSPGTGWTSRRAEVSSFMAIED
jgi:hypothetical protein